MMKIKKITEVSENFDNLHEESSRIHSLLVSLLGYLQSCNGSNDRAGEAMSISLDILDLVVDKLDDFVCSFENCKSYLGRYIRHFELDLKEDAIFEIVPPDDDECTECEDEEYSV